MDREWTWDLQMPQTAYDYFKELARVPTSNYSVYVTNPLDDAYVSGLAAKILEAATGYAYSEYETAELAASFVQSLPYVLDDVSTPYDEYPRYPIETLVDNGGDCEDTAILLASLLHGMGYSVVLLLYPETPGVPGHLAVGVSGGGRGSGTYYEYQGAKYYYLETTGSGWGIGDIPDDYAGRQARILALNPVPVLTHEWTAQGQGQYAELIVKVSNLGSADAPGVYIYAGFDAGDDKMWNPEQSPVFDVGVDDIVTVTLSIRIPTGKHTRIRVQIVYEGHSVDDSHSEWFDT